MTYTKAHRGFTLIELMMAIVILTLMSAIIYTNFASSRANSRDARRVSDIKLIQVALDNYYLQNGTYPCCDTSDTNLQKLVPDYMSVLPKDPKTNTNYFYGVYALTGSNCPTARPVQYHLGAAMESDDQQNGGNFNRALARDDYDWNPATSGFTFCSSGGGNDFHGKAIRTSTLQPCDGLAGAGVSTGVDKCYDVTN
jgi:prepilin-type N-terminal cleavage/methylation domain-containing protein